MVCPTPAFIGYREEVYLHATSCPYKSLSSYQGNMAQQFSRGLLTTCEIGITLSCCTLWSWKGSYMILDT